MSLCGKSSLQFSLNKMKSFLTELQAGPWVFFIKSWSFVRVRVRSVVQLTCSSKSICVVLCCMDRSRALLIACLTHTRHLWVVQSMREGLGAWGRVILLLEYSPALWEPVCNTTQLSHAIQLVGLGLGKANWSIRKGWPKGDNFNGR